MQDFRASELSFLNWSCKKGKNGLKYFKMICYESVIIAVPTANLISSLVHVVIKQEKCM